MRRVALLRSLQLRASVTAVGAFDCAAATQASLAATTSHAAALAALPTAGISATSAHGSLTGGQHHRCISAAAILLSEAGKPTAGGSSGGGGTPPPDSAAAAPQADAAEGAMYGSEDEEDEEAEAAMAEAFERLIQAAFEMVQQGKPMEADYVLTEGAPHHDACSSSVEASMCCTQGSRGWCMRRCCTNPCGGGTRTHAGSAAGAGCAGAGCAGAHCLAPACPGVDPRRRKTGSRDHGPRCAGARRPVRPTMHHSLPA